MSGIMDTAIDYSFVLPPRSKAKEDIYRYGAAERTFNKTVRAEMATGRKVFDHHMRFTAEALWRFGFRDAYKEFQENGWPYGSTGK